MAGYRTLKGCLDDLEIRGDLIRIDSEVDPNLEVGAIQRRVFQAGGPALLFTRVKGTSFPMAGNVFGTMDRIRFIFRDSLKRVERMLALKGDPTVALKRPWEFLGVPRGAWHTLPKTVNKGPVLANETSISRLPALRSWPMDGGPFVTLPLVYSEHPAAPGYGKSNLGMYRVQLSGGQYEQNREVGLHYQIHRGIGAHHGEAIRRGEPLRVNIVVGGPPALTVAAVMPLPEGIAELVFAGALGGHRIPMVARKGGLPIPAEADFCITGTIAPGRELPEGPFGDHLGYYSLTHDFPVLKVDRVFHRDGAIWPFTTVGRPPQEDTMFGTFIHELTADLIPTVFAGVHEVHAVDAAGVHPLLLAVGSERYVPYAAERRPQELITSGMHLLGSSQTSLAKYLFIGAREDDEGLSSHDIPGFFKHMLERIDPGRDLHFITRTTMDTLDYSGTGLNSGSKVIVAAAGPVRRVLRGTIPGDLALPDSFGTPKLLAPGILLVQGPKHDRARGTQDPAMEFFCETVGTRNDLEGIPLIVVVDDAEFSARSWENFLWTTFTRSDPATDMYGVRAFTDCKHWGCRGPLVIDARLKSFQAPPLEEDPDVEKRVDALGAPGGPLHGVI